MTNQQKAYAYAGIAIFFWSTVASAFKIGLAHLDVIQFLFFSTAASFLVFFIIIAGTGRLADIRKVPLKKLALFSVLGLLNPFSYYLILFKAYSVLPAQIAQPLNMVWPIVLVFLSVILLHQKIRIRSIIALFVCFAGVFLISTQGEPWAGQIKNPLGVALAVGSSLIWSFYWILNMKNKGEETIPLLIAFFFALIYITIAMFLFSSFHDLSIKGIVLSLYSGVFEMGISFLLWIKALKLSRSTDKISILVYLAPFLSLIFIHIFVGEKILFTSVGGLLLIVAGIIFEKIRSEKIR